MRDLSARMGRDRRGGVAVIFALALVPMIGIAGAAVDYWRASNIQGNLQKTADAAALVAAKGNATFDEREAAARAFVDSQLASESGPAHRTTIIPVMEGDRETGVRVTLTVASPTTLMNVFGVRAIDVAVDAVASSGRNELVDVAFVLDTTGSMAGDRLEVLKRTTTDLIDDFIARRAERDQIRVSVIPFGQYVNVGLGNRTQPWLDVPADHQTPVTQTCEMVREVVGQQCTRVWQEPQPARPKLCYDDGRPYQCGSPATPGRWVDQCTSIHGPNMVQRCRNNGGNWVRWNGCVGSRAYPNETRDSNYSLRIPGLMNISCGSPILEPTNDLALAKSRIQTLTTAGETYIPAGLIWGWRALSTHAPIAARAERDGARVSRYMVLVTDGQNTRSPNYPHHAATNPAEADRIMRSTCENMAADRDSGIRLYTIAYEVTDPNVKQLLEECSTMNGGAFYDAGDASALGEAMRDIGGQISRLRITS